MDKTGLRVITPARASEKRQDKEIYKAATLRFMERYGDFEQFETTEDWYKEHTESFKKFLFLAVRLIRYGRNDLRDMAITKETAEQQMNLMFAVENMFSLLTPLELVQIFPVTKRYDGAKWQEKDYFFTMKKLQGLDWDKPIKGQTDIFELLIDYQNLDIDFFVVEVTEAIDRVRRAQGQPGMLEEFMGEQGVPTYTYHEKEGYLYNRETGKTVKVEKPRRRLPKYFKVVKGGRKE